jgi:hypothetical protein
LEACGLHVPASGNVHNVVGCGRKRLPTCFASKEGGATVVQCQHIVAGRRYHVDSQCGSFPKTHSELSSSGYI